MSTWSKVRDAIESFFSGTVWSFLKPFIETVERNGGDILINAAQHAVAVGFATQGNGQAKMEAALLDFSAEVMAKGIPFIESQARALIEVALQTVKTATQAPAAA